LPLRIIRILADALVSYIVFGISCLVPKKKGKWLFGAWYGEKYSDNPKYVFEHLLGRHPEVEAIWIVKDKALLSRMRAAGLPVAHAFSFAGMRHQLRAELVMYTHSVQIEFAAPLIAPWVKRVQAWHGIPIKKIGYDDNTQQHSRFRRRLRALVFPCDLDRCDLVIAGSEADADRYRTAFNVRPENVRITGYPKNDELIRSVARRPPGLRTRRALYMPTFRGAPGSEFQLFRTTGFGFAKVDEALGRIGWHLFVKLHPVQKFSADDLRQIDRAANIDSLSGDQDIYEQAGAYDCVVTDFSSITFDFLITGKPVVMAPFEIENYIAKDRQLYYEYDEICPDEPCATWDDVLARLASLPLDGPRGARYTKIQSRFHRFLDANSSQRVVAELKALAGAE
jgi:CDP-glycerol glycerophosphotransferase (TagB/SpsB family)